jgi:hypothetical protein
LEFIGQDIDQSGLASTVGTQNGNTTVHVHAEINIFIKNLLRCVAEFAVLDFENRRRDFIRFGELKADAYIVLHLLDHHHFFQFLHAALRHGST